MVRTLRSCTKEYDCARGGRHSLLALHPTSKMPVPVISVAQMREWEKATWASGQSEAAVMRLAGQAVARRAEQLTLRGGFILVLSGKGHNGDDARLAAESISGRETRVLRTIDPETIGAELAPLLARRPGLIIDGLFV